MRKVLLLHTGGTLMMQRAGAALTPDAYKQDVLTALPVLHTIADIDTQILFNHDSTDLQPRHWVELARAVHTALDDHDGIVVVHGTDTMAYTASAMAFLLPGLDRPVVFTGSQTPLSDVRTDARTNLVDAFHVATMNIPEVGIVFASRLYRGCRATKADAWSMWAFDSPGCPPLATLGIGVSLGRHVLAPRPVVPFDDRIEDRVLAVRIFPGLEPRLLTGALGAGVRGLVLEAFGTGNVPRLEKSFLPVFEHARKLDVPVVLVSQCHRGTIDLSQYQGGVLAAQMGAISAHDMTTEAAIAKLMVALGRCDLGESRIQAARAAFEELWVGEFTQPVAPKSTDG